MLATVEQHAATSEGVIGFWDSTDWTRLDQRPSGGIGPHEVLTLHDDATLIVANGGIATDPTDRTKLNLDTMRPNLAVLAADGSVTVTELPGMQQASIRHLALSPQGDVAFAMQWEGNPGQIVPLLGLLRPGQDPVLAHAPDPELRLMQGYAGSVCFDADGGTVAITSPVGGRFQRYDRAGHFIAAHARPDVCGVARLGQGLLFSDGGGALIAVDGAEPRLVARHPVAWDNHLVEV